MSSLVINDVPIECINQAARTYSIPATLIISILKIEGGKNGLAQLNNDGSFDYGPMQINSRWLNKIKKYGYTQTDLQYNPCDNVMVGTWILVTNIVDGKNLWDGIGNYHSHNWFLKQRYSNKIEYFYRWLEKEIKKPI